MTRIQQHDRHSSSILVVILCCILVSLVLLNVFLSERVDDHLEPQRYFFHNHNKMTTPSSSTRQQPIVTSSSSSSPASSSNTTLVIIIGNLRGGERAWQTLYEKVLDVNMADLALVVGESSNRTSSLYQRARYLYEFPEYDDYADAIDTIANSTAWRQYLLPLNLDPYGLFGGASHRHGSGAIIFMCRYYVTLFLQQHNLLKKYSRFVITRSDHYYACSYDMSQLSNEYIHVPIGEDWKGITDRHLIVSSAHVLQALNMYPPLIHNTSKLLLLLRQQPNNHGASSSPLLRMNPESFIKERWKEEGIWNLVRRHDRVMFTCAVDGDTTRWQRHSHTAEKDYGGVYVKYRMEFDAAKCNCDEHTVWNETEKMCNRREPR